MQDSYNSSYQFIALSSSITRSHWYVRPRITLALKSGGLIDKQLAIYSCWMDEQFTLNVPHTLIATVYLTSHCWLRRQGGYVIVVVCLLATCCKNFRTDLHEIFMESWQWANEQIKRLNFSGDPDHGSGSGSVSRHSGETCLGGGMHCPVLLVKLVWYWLFYHEKVYDDTINRFNLCTVGLKPNSITLSC